MRGTRMLVARRRVRLRSPLLGCVLAVLLGSVLGSVLVLDASAAGTPFDALRSQLLQQVQAAYPTATSINIEPARATALTALPECNQPWVLDLQGQRLSGPVAVRASCPAVRRALRLTLVIQVQLPTLVAEAALPRGSVLAARSLQLKSVPATLGMNPVSDVGLFVGRRLRMAVRAGQTLRPDMLEPEQWVNSGDEVSLAAGDGSVSVTVAAKALQDGGPGEQIRVRNSSSGRVVAAWVIGRGRTATRAPSEPPSGLLTADRANDESLKRIRSND